MVRIRGEQTDAAADTEALRTTAAARAELADLAVGHYLTGRLDTRA